MTRVRHIHSSGRHDRPAKKIRAALDDYAHRADIITLTEYQDDEHRDVLTSWAIAHRFTIAQASGPAGNCVITAGPGFTILDGWYPRLTDYEQRRGPGGPPPPHAATALIRHDATGARSLWSVAHLPPNVEGDWRARNPRGGRGGRAYRVWLWLTIVRAWRAHLRAVRRRTGVRRRAVVADFNLNLERAWVRAVLRAQFPGLRPTWRRFPGPGTHGRRIIDATVTNLRIIDAAELLRDDASSDHRPYREVLGL